MDLVLLPVETISLILLYLPKSFLKHVYDQLPKNNSLKDVVESTLYRRLYYGAELAVAQDVDLYHISNEELCDLARGKLKARVYSLKITLFDSERNLVSKDTFLNLCKEYPGFISEIQVIDFNAFSETFEEFVTIVTLNNVVNLSLVGASKLRSELIPPNLKSISLQTNYEVPKDLILWPASLKSMHISACPNAKSIPLPSGLEELSCAEIEEHWKQFPLSIRTLDLSNDVNIPWSSFEFPKLLTDLNISGCNMELSKFLLRQLPPYLKYLNMGYNHLRSLARVKLPESLKVLNAQYCGIASLEKVVFPSLLEQLNVAHNHLKSLKNVHFPNLKKLDISCKPKSNPKLIKFMSKVTLPSTIDTLLAEGQPVEDWSKTYFPESLRVLHIRTLKGSKSLKLPLSLEVLKIQFSESSGAKYSDLKLPATLCDLTLEYGKSSEFDWKLPFLKTMNVSDFSGFITIPDTVERLAICADQNITESLKVPNGVEKLIVSYMLKEYPDSVTDLRIRRYQVKKHHVFPLRLERLYLDNHGFPKHINGDLVKLPSNLQVLSGCFKPLPELPASLKYFHRMRTDEEWDELLRSIEDD